MDARQIIADLRRGARLSDEALQWFAEGLADGRVSDAQAGAFAMAVCWRGLDKDGRGAFTRAMRDSGDVMQWDLPGPVVDKHSTGGVGDCVSLLLAPALAACGTYVPMISGRGLGHTGGTLDKLEAIPGVTTSVSGEKLQQIVADVGCAIVGATGNIAPADKRLYAIRDVTSTVESLDLITASILSKKLAASPDVLVLDVKLGSGAFMKSLDEARQLARSLTETATAAGCSCRALITDMDQPLVPALGNGLEIAIIMEALQEGKHQRLQQLTARLGGELLESVGIAQTAEAGSQKIVDALADGSAADRFGQMVYQLGGPADFNDQWRVYLPNAPITRNVRARRAGYVAAINGEELGHAVVHLGGGRLQAQDQIDPSVGVGELLSLGTWCEAGDVIAVVHAASASAADQAEHAILRSVQIGPEKPSCGPLVLERH